jgi:rhamnosyltransferase subunit B
MPAGRARLDEHRGAGFSRTVCTQRAHKETGIAIPSRQAPDTRFVVVTIGSAGDLFPFMAMALALRAAGHRVSFLAPAQHEPFVRGSGLDFTGLPADEAVLHDPDLWHPTRGFGVVWRATRPGMARIVSFVDALPADERIVLLVHPLALPEADLCRATRPALKVAAAYLAPQNLPTVHDPLLVGPWRVPPWVPFAARRALWRWGARTFIDPVALPDVNAARAARGLRPMASLLSDLFGLADVSLTLFPAWFAPTQPDWPQTLVRTGFPLFDPTPEAALAPALLRFLEAGPAPVVFTHGTGNVQARAYFHAACAAVQQRGLRAILLTPRRDQVPLDLPPAILWQDYVPLRRLLPRVAALVHHGGIGTTAEALRAGTPQLVVPLAHDQFDNAARVEALGVGLGLRAGRVNAARLAAKLMQLTDNAGLTRQCQAVSARFDGSDPMRAVVDRLQALAGEDGGVTGQARATAPAKGAK